MFATFALALLVAAILAGCGDDSDEANTTEVPVSDDAGAPGKEASAKKDDEAEKQDSSSKGPKTKVTLQDSQFGSILFDDEGGALYLFTADGDDESNCYDECADAWPPFLTKGEPVAGDGVDQSLLGTTKRDDGSTQITYAGSPLYYYVDDPPNEVLCHNVNEFGGDWLVVQASGKPAD